MNDQDLDPLLRALGELEREEHERPYPAQWEAVLAGRTTPAEAAAARAGEDPEELRVAYEAAFTGPLPEADIQAMVDRVATTLRADGATIVRPRFGRRLVLGVAVVLAVAAALVLWQLPREPPRPDLVAYSLSVRNPGMQDKRASDGPDDRYLPDSKIDWILSPELATTEAVALRVLARDEAGAVRSLAPTVTPSPDGALRIRGRFAEQLKLTPGRWQLRFVICAGTGPDTAEAVEAALAAQHCVEAKEQLALSMLPPN